MFLHYCRGKGGTLEFPANGRRFCSGVNHVFHCSSSHPLDGTSHAATTSARVAIVVAALVSGTLRQYLKNLLKLALTTIPFMILAALLGAIVAEMFPVQEIPAHVTFVGIVLVALAGTFLPVPIAFDVAAAFILMTRGVPLPYVVTLLCTLGAFSIYSVLIVGRTMSWKTTAKVFGAVMAVGILAGVGTAVMQHGF